MFFLLFFLFSFSQAQDSQSDPFVHHSQFESFQNEGEEQRYIDFFRHGRFFDIGFIAGYTGFTKGYAQLNRNSPHVGLFINYFLSLRFSLYYTFVFAKIPEDYEHHNQEGNTVQHRLVLSHLDNSIGFRTYINPEKTIQKISLLNPYILLGLNYFYLFKRATAKTDAFSDPFVGAHIGLGLELPLVRKKIALGIEFLYKLFNPETERRNFSFKDPNSDSDALIPTELFLNGDSFALQFLIGAEF